MAMQKKTVGDDPDQSLRPVLPDQRHECRKVWMDGRFTAEKTEFVDGDSTAPLCHPAIRYRRIEVASVAVV